MSNLKARMTSSKKPKATPASTFKNMSKVNLFATATPLKTPMKTKAQLAALSQTFASKMKEVRWRARGAKRRVLGYALMCKV